MLSVSPQRTVVFIALNRKFNRCLSFANNTNPSSTLPSLPLISNQCVGGGLHSCCAADTVINVIGTSALVEMVNEDNAGLAAICKLSVSGDGFVVFLGQVGCFSS